MISSNSAAVKYININIANMLESEILVNIDIGKGEIDPALQRTNAAQASWSLTGPRLASPSGMLPSLLSLYYTTSGTR